MMKYEIRHVYKDKMYEVVETSTDQVIDVYTDVFGAQQAKTHLNRGGGFDGWTPSFMLKNNFQPKIIPWNLRYK